MDVRNLLSQNLVHCVRQLRDSNRTANMPTHAPILCLARVIFFWKSGDTMTTLYAPPQLPLVSMISWLSDGMHRQESLRHTYKMVNLYGRAELVLDLLRGDGHGVEVARSGERLQASSNFRYLITLWTGLHACISSLAKHAIPARQHEPGRMRGKVHVCPR